MNRFPRSETILYNYAATLQSNRKYGSALEIYGKLLDLNPSYPNIHYNMALCHYYNDDAFRAERELRAYFDRGGSAVSRAHILMGMIYSDKQDFRQAEEQFRRAIQKDPDNGDAYVHLGNVLHALGDKRGAVNAYREALRINPRDRQAKKNLKRLVGAPRGSF